MPAASPAPTLYRFLRRDPRFWFAVFLFLFGAGAAAVSGWALAVAPVGVRRTVDPTPLIVLLGLGLATMALCGALARLCVRRAAFWRRLTIAGERHPAEIIGVDRVGRAWRLRYAYDDVAGRSREGRSELGPRHRVEGLRPGMGATIFVDPENPSRSAWSGDLG